MSDDMRYERHETREDGEEAVHSDRHRLNDIECPNCGSEDIEVLQWDVMMTSSAKAVCDCGFEHREDYSHRELDHSRSEGPVELVRYEVRPDLNRWWSSWEFSPRLFLEMVTEDSP